MMRRPPLALRAWLTPVFTLILMLAAPAYGQERSGWEFFRQATLYADPAAQTPNAEVFVAEFNGYLWGAAHILQKQGTVCLPETVALDELWLPVHQALQDNPAQRQRSRSDLVAELLPALFPCTDADAP